uniref:Uncharacterized protein n=2 Tax=Nelumbo nucifera TaxID=4432 RepID=A0A822YK05_NELNU|nr:TPA_asm: hypothetical protein HUJ06_031166 [Nelumbo nucifera]
MSEVNCRSILLCITTYKRMRYSLYVAAILCGEVLYNCRVQSPVRYGRSGYRVRTLRKPQRVWQVVLRDTCLSICTLLKEKSSAEAELDDPNTIFSDWRLRSLLTMAAKYIVGAVLGTFGFAYVMDNLISDQKLFGGKTPKTVANKEWYDETDKKFQAWPRTAGPPVMMNPISRQNFIIKSHSES